MDISSRGIYPRDRVHQLQQPLYKYPAVTGERRAGKPLNTGPIKTGHGDRTRWLP